MSEVEQIILPDGYTRLDFLQSIGNEVIYTGIIPTDKHGFYAEVESCGGTGYACGTQTGAGLPGHWIYVSQGVLQASYENNIKTTVSSKSKVTIKNNFLNDRKLVADGTVVKNYSQDFTYNWSYEFTLFKSTYGGNAKFDPVAPIRFYRFKISENEKIVRDFIPCLDENNVPCMYDILGLGTIKENTYYNQGTGNFITNKELEFEYIHTPYNLPAGFKKCVYLQSDGTQWINTQVVPNTETGLYFRALRLCYGNLVPFGIGENGFDIYPPRYNSKELFYKWGKTGVKMMNWDKADDLIFSSYLNFYNSKIAKFNSADTDAILAISSQTGTFTNPIWLFSSNNNGSYNATYGKWIGRIYRAQMTQGDALIRDFVPCLDTDNRPCMYDLVTQEAYYNQSGGTEFTYCVEHELPSDFLKLKYLESDGMQFIKTGYVPTNTTGLYIEAYNTVGGDFVPMGCRNDTGNTRFFIARVTKTNTAGFGWGTWTAPGGTGDCRYEATLNWLNDRKSIINAPSFAQRVNNLGTLPHTPLYGINIFGANHQDTSNELAWKGRIYRAKISEGDQIVRDYVPAYDNRRNKPCMYDLINNVAYYNDGEGEFIYNRDFEGTYKGYTGLGCIGNKLGSDYDPINEKLPSGYTRVDFLESKNGEYIKLGLNATNFSSYIKFSMLTPSNFNGSGPAYVFTTPLNTYRVEGWPYDSSMTWEPHWVLFDTVNNKNQWGGMIGGINYGEYAFCKIDLTSKKITVSSPYASKSVVSNIKDEFINLEHGEITLFPRNNSVRWFSRIYFFQGNYDGVDATNLIPSLDENGKPCFYDIIRQISLYNEKQNTDFIIGLKTLSHALQLYLPDSGGTIHLSLPTNDKTEIYEEKIRANNPNWEITFYYH